MKPEAPPVTLTIAGSDCSSGAGIQADLKTFTAFGTYGLTAVTCVVAEVPGRVTEIAPVSPSVVGEQIRLLTGSFPVAAAKTGMLYSRVHIRATTDALPEEIPLVVDPVMVATSGTPLLLDDAVGAYWNEVFPRAAVITPNLDEAAYLLGRPIGDIDALEAAARELSQRAGVPVLLKGGHLQGETATDVLIESHDGKAHHFSAPFVRGISTHGTGCTYSAAITAGLASGAPLPLAVARAKKFVTAAILATLHWGDTQALDHRQNIAELDD